MSENFNIDDISNLASIELSEEEKAKERRTMESILVQKAVGVRRRRSDRAIGGIQRRKLSIYINNH